MFNRVLFWVALILLVLNLAQCAHQSTQQRKIQQSQSLLTVLKDSLHHSRDSYGRHQVSKTALEVPIQTLEANHAVLNANQRSLVQDVRHLPRATRRKLTTATSIKQAASVADVVNVAPKQGKQHVWQHSSDTLNYSIRVAGDTLTIDSLSIPNRQLLYTHYDSRDRLHITVVDTNPLVKTLEVDHVVPPGKKPSVVGKVLLVLGGVAAGYFISR